MKTLEAEKVEVSASGSWGVTDKGEEIEREKETDIYRFRNTQGMLQPELSPGAVER